MSIVTRLVSAPMKPCTAMIITKDGARTIQKTLDSIIEAGCFNEILVLLDDRTRDETPAILQAYADQGVHIRVIPYRWAVPPDFSAARNYLLQFVRTPYATWLDDDETVAEPDKFHRMLRQARGQCFFMFVVSPMRAGDFNMYQPRLFPVVPGIFWECPVFERLDFSLRRAGVPCKKTMYAPIAHSGYANDRMVELKNKRNREVLRRAALSFVGGYEQMKHLATQYRALVE